MMFEHVEAYVAVCCYSHNYWLFKINIRSMRWIRSTEIRSESNPHKVVNVRVNKIMVE